MQIRRAAITGVGGYVPDYIMTNRELETMVDTSDEWIRTRTGIKERRVLKEEGKATSDMGVAAVNEMLKKMSIDPMDIDLLICGTVTGDMVFPDTANTICHKIGAKNAFGFDVNAACSGFLYSLTIGTKFVESGTYDKVVVVGVDMMSSIIDYSDRTTCVLFGDGGGCVMLEPTTEDYGVIDAILRGDGEGRQFLHMPGGGSLEPPTLQTIKDRRHFVRQEGKQVFKAAVKGMTSSVMDLAGRNHLKGDDVDWIVPHQANQRIIAVVADSLGVSMDKVMLNIHKFGNTTSGTIPLCLWEWEKQLNKGDNLILTAFGGGYTWGAVYVKWAYDGSKVGV